MAGVDAAADDDRVLDVRATPERLRLLRDAGAIDAATWARARARVSASPGPAAWIAFARAACLVVGVTLVVSGVFFFFAYNWAHLGRLTKLACVASTLVAAVGVALRVGVDRPVGRVSLGGATVLVGALLAVFGQAYQTGADAWQLFATWAFLITPWVVAAEMPSLVALQVALAQLSLTLYWDVRFEGASSFAEMCLALAAIAASVWLVCEAVGSRRAWLASRGLAGLLGCMTLGPLVFGGCAWITMREHDDGISCFGAAIVAIAASIVRHRGRDLFQLAIAAAGAITLLTTILARALIDRHADDAGSFFLVGGALVAQIATAAHWLRREQREMRAS
jgi:hypothetical protein